MRDTTPTPPPPAPVMRDTTPTPPPAPLTRDTTTMITAVVPAPRMRARSYGGMYFGLGGGWAMPQSEFSSAYNNGYDLTAMLGVDPIGWPLGIRADVGYNHLGSMTIPGAVSFSDAKAYSANIDAKLHLTVPFADRFRARVYAVGGVGANRFTNYGFRNGGVPGAPPPTGTAFTTGVNTPFYGTSFSNSPTLFGWNAGGGISFGYGATELFVESRYFDVNTSSDLGYHTRYVPVVIGLTIY